MTTKEPKTDWKVMCTGLICLTVLEVIALLKGFNGVVLNIVIGIIAIALGITIKNPFIK